MNLSRVRALFALLPSGAGYQPIVASPFRPRTQQPAEDWARAGHDPAFGDRFVQAHLRTGHWLPRDVNEWPLVQAFAVQWFRVADPLMREVESFQTSARRQERDILDALLLAAGVPFADIAALFGVTEEVVEAYAIRFWNVRDRLAEPAFIPPLLHPAGAQATRREPSTGAADDRLRLLRAGFKSGLDKVLELAEFQPPAARDHGADERDRFERNLLEEAGRRWEAGARMEDPVVKAAWQRLVTLPPPELGDQALAFHKGNSYDNALEEIRKHSGIGGERGQTIQPPSRST